MLSKEQTTSHPEGIVERRVLLLETDERHGLVAALAAVCAANGVSLEISTGPGHVLITFASDQATTNTTHSGLLAVPGVESVQAFVVKEWPG